ncbi:hypothetical protein J437_LFUL003541 [Ladona fulva]|uniref:Ribosomal RNA-processing protein 7 homolog A n=1 Tax=Ladona fulva TaxID=123851 RepID=A0A8K0JV02_LADFU|nr:hypothetical protein J437_LFUL003541 [Ladona fulva]
MVPEMEKLGFKVIPIKFAAESTAQHSLFVKEHAVRVNTDVKPPHRTLFVLNIPSYSTEASIKRVFSEKCDCPVEAVYFHKKPTSSEPPEEDSKFFTSAAIQGFKVGYVVFKSSVGLKAALSLSSIDPLILSSESKPVSTGYEKWAKEYNQRIPDSKELQAEIDKYMTEYDAEQEKIKMKEKEGEADEEGWITVTRRGRKPGFSRKESVHKKVMGRERQKRSRKELLNFYTFQIRESKMKHVAELRQKFEEDKKRIEMLKQARRFKPY